MSSFTELKLSGSHLAEEHDNLPCSQQSLLMLNLIVQGEIDIQQNELLSQSDTFSHLRVDLLS